MQFEYLDPDKIIGTQEFIEVEKFLKRTGRTQIGWHYIVDLTWIYSQAKKWPVGSLVLDAGGGLGPTQFLLAEMGMNVVNIDLLHQGNFYYAQRYKLESKQLSSYVKSEYVAHLHSTVTHKADLASLREPIINNMVTNKLRLKYYEHMHESWKRMVGYSDRCVGKITRLSGNLCGLPEIHDSKYDAVVSLSALEHIPIAMLPDALAEINRVVKPDGSYAVTTSATDKATWFHEPSKGLCFSKDDLEKLFGAELQGTTDAASTLDKYRQNSYLSNNLADFYKKLGNNGMPWGKWDPQYVPVGISV
jgi:2-polyprenyl-3-methyl-5-hydroxy-6-metoxy-1,4-benzoquinol methylase